MAAAAVPEINTAIAHLRDVLGDPAYESLARKGKTMTRVVEGTTTIEKTTRLSLPAGSFLFGAYPRSARWMPTITALTATPPAAGPVPRKGSWEGFPLLPVLRSWRTVLPTATPIPLPARKGFSTTAPRSPISMSHNRFHDHNTTVTARLDLGFRFHPSQ
jgi:hypothetical protein